MLPPIRRGPPLRSRLDENFLASALLARVQVPSVIQMPFTLRTPENRNFRISANRSSRHCMHFLNVSRLDEGIHEFNRHFSPAARVQADEQSLGSRRPNLLSSVRPLVIK